MKFFVSRFYLLIVVGLMSVIQTLPAAAAERWALLIGNDDYTVLPPLRNPVNDINELADRLESLGFNVVTHENLSDSASMGEAVQTFAEEAKAAGAEAVLVHYAGHGFEIGGENYLVPAGISQASESELVEKLTEEVGDQPMEDEDRSVRLGQMRLEHIRKQSLKLNQVLGIVEQAAPTRILLFDACRDVPNMRSLEPSYSPENTNAGFAVAEGSAGTLITFSAQPGQVASDGSGPVSPFMQALLDHIDLRAIDINDLMTRVRRDVHVYTQGYQVPWTHSALLDSFYFRPPGSGGDRGDQNVAEEERPGLVAVLPSSDSSDEQYWQSIANSLDADAYHEYLQKFPDGAHVAEAEDLLSKLGSVADEGGAEAASDPSLQVAVNEPVSRQFDSEEEMRKRIVIVGDSDFAGDRLSYAGGLTVGLPDALVDRIAANLSKSPRFRVLEREDLRRVISEQRFDERLGDSYLKQTFEESFGDVRPDGGDMVIIPDGSPLDGTGIVVGTGLGSSAATADYLDLLEDFKDLGSSIDAEYLIFGRIEAVDHEVEERRIPYTERTHVSETMNARLRIRVVDVKQARIISAAAIESELEADVFEGGPSAVHSAMFDILAREVTGALADSFHQAAVIKTDPLVVDRGAIHGLQPGDRLTIERREDESLVSEDGINLGSHKTYMATVEVRHADDLWSEVELVEGMQPALYDLARLDRDARHGSAGDEVTAARAQPKALKPGGEPKSGLPRLAVLPVQFTGAAATSGLMAGQSGGDWEGPFAQNLAALLHQSRRFQMLDRYDLDSLFDEADLAALTGGGPLPGELIDLGIADHLVLTEISLLEIATGDVGGGAGSSSTAAELAGLHAGMSRAFLEGVVRIADGRTGTWLEGRQISISLDVDASRSEARIVADLAKAFAAKAGVELINTVFPLKVASVTQTGTVYVNRGLDGGLEIGEILTAYRQGAEVVDPDTGIKLGREEKMVGQVTLTRVDDFSSIGTLADLNQPLAKNDHLRRQTWNRGKTSGGSQVSALGSAGNNEARGGQRVVALGKIEVASGGRFDLPPADLVPRFSQELANRLRTTGRYVVSERQAFTNVLDESYVNNMIEGRAGLPEELKSVDYLALARLDNLLIDRAGEYVSVLDETFEVTKAVAEVQLRMVDVRSFEQVASETIRFERELEDDIDPHLLVGEMVALAADEAVQQMMNASHPVEIIGGGQGRWYVNRGADGGLSIGDAFTIVREGEEMVDAAGISFGRAETEVGRGMVIQVDAARSMIEIQDVSGDVSIGDILRPFKGDPERGEAAATPSSKTPENQVNTPKW